MDIWARWQEEKEQRRQRHEHEFLYTNKKMESILTLIRDPALFTDKSTIGKLLLDNEFQCNTLEDTVRDPNKDGRLQKEEKIWGETAIPAGRYEIVIYYSKKFQKKLPLLLNVPYFKGIAIHPLNEASESLGCIGVGTYDPLVPNWIGASRAAFNDLMPKIEKVLNYRKLFIEIKGGPTA